MKAAYVKVRNKVTIRDIEAPHPAAGEVVLRIEGCGVCGSDYIEATAWAKRRKRFGHEIAAIIEEAGPGVTGFAPGDQVALALSAPCGQCAHCLAGDPRRCGNLVLAEQGGFAERLLVRDTRLLSRVPCPLPPELLIFAEPLSVLLDAFHTVDLRPGDNLAVVGGGFLACLGLLAAKAVGATPVLALSRGLHPGLEACLAAAGAEHCRWRSVAGVTIAAPQAFAQKLEQTTGRIVVLHTAPPRHIPTYLDKLPFNSTVVNIGLSGKRKDNILKVDASRFIFKRVQLLSAFPVPCLYMDEAVRLLDERRELFSLLAPEIIPLEELPQRISASHKAKRKLMVIPAPSGKA